SFYLIHIRGRMEHEKPPYKLFSMVLDLTQLYQTTGGFCLFYPRFLPLYLDFYGKNALTFYVLKPYRDFYGNSNILRLVQRGRRAQDEWTALFRLKGLLPGK